MADMNFGVNLLPTTNNSFTIGDSTHKWQLFVSSINGNTIPSNELVEIATLLEIQSYFDIETAPTVDATGVSF